MMQVGRCSFARGGYNRFVVCKGSCSWCGESRRRMFNYVWQGDDKPGVVKPTNNLKFCGFQCFRYYNGG